MPITHKTRGIPTFFGLKGASAWDREHTLPTSTEVGADPAGTAAAAITTHEAAANPHPTYLTQAEGDALYEPKGVTVTPTYTAPSTLTVTTGTLAAGTVADLAAAGGTTVDIAEASGTPGFDIEVVFSSLVGVPIGFGFVGWYQGNTAHEVTIDAWNYTTSAWDNFGLAETRTALKAYGFTYPKGADYVSAGAAKFRLYHVSAGTGTHDMWLDVAYVTTLVAT
jgi:hypothetical protein